MINFYTVIAYMSDGADYCRGCLMDQWGSRFEEIYTEDKEQAINFIVEYLYENKLNEQHSNIGIYGITLLINGRRNYDQIWNEADQIIEDENPEYQEIMNKAQVISDEKFKINEEKKAQVKIAEQKRAIEAQKTRDLAEFNRLAKKLQGEV